VVVEIGVLVVVARLLVVVERLVEVATAPVVEQATTKASSGGRAHLPGPP
jgi:hypothetical protein